MTNLTSLSRIRLHAAWIVFLVVPVAAAAQSPEDLKAYGDYTLNIENYQQYLDAALNLANVAVMDTELAKRLNVMAAQPLAEQVKQLNGNPEARGAIAKTGLTTRDFVLVQGAAFQTGKAHSLVKSGKLSMDNAIKRPGVSRANLEFFQKNEARISRLVQDYVSRKPKT
ncbi:MAG TPA: hypothetical protein VIG08_09075 [Gemmatimonadales bacterium]|jgi:hypothetical protein